MVAPTAPPRRPRIGPNSIVVVVEDLAGTERAWRIVPDPRPIRAESALPSGTGLSSETLFYLDTELLILIPATSDVARLRLFKPVASGGAIRLDPFGVVSLR
jgi:hypothetical protein